MKDGDSKNTKGTKTVFHYGNYRDFLRDHFNEAKSTDKKFTFRHFSKVVGFKSHSFFQLVLKGERNMTDDSIEKISLALKFNKQEKFFFRNLVMMNQAASAEERQSYAEQLLKSREYKKLFPLSEAQYSYFSQWYYVPIREIVAVPGFKEDPHWIAKQLKPEITVAQAKKALDDLIAMGLLKRDESGQLVQSEDNVATPDEVVSAYLTQFHQEMIKKAGESIGRFKREKREVSSVSFPMSDENVKKIKEIIYECRTRILELTTHDPGSNAVYQLNFQLFPLAELSGEENKSES